jgi:hypothetical protein
MPPLAGWWWALVGLLVTIKVALTQAQPAQLMLLDYDDQLFVKLGWYISRGEWLGPYDFKTLIKGPFYPLFIAGVHAIGVPLLMAQHLLYALFSLVAVIAIRPAVRNRWLLLMLLTFLLFNLGTYSSPTSQRLLRDGIYPALVGLVLACGTGLLLRVTSPRGEGRLLPWSLGLGVALSGYWLTREESVFLMPSTAILLVAALAAVIRQHWLQRTTQAGKPQRVWAMVRPVAMLVLPWIVLSGSLLSISYLNYRYYGFFGTNELKAPWMTAAYGALARIKSSSTDRYVPAPRDARERAYEVSPTFAQLRSNIEGQPGQFWQMISENQERRSKGDIAGGWFIFALRGAVAANGHSNSIADAEKFYRAMASEINDACDSGKIPAKPRHDSFAPPITRELIPPLWDGVWRSMAYTLTVPDFSVEVPPSTLPPWAEVQMTRMSNQRMVGLNTMVVSGWAFSPTKGSVQVSLQTEVPVKPAGGPADAAQPTPPGGVDSRTGWVIVPQQVTRGPDVSVYNGLARAGIFTHAAYDSRFTITTTDPRPVQLAFTVGDQLIDRVGIRVGSGQSNDLICAIDEAYISEGGETNFTAVDKWRLKSLEFIGQMYQKSLRPLAICGAAAWLLTLVLVVMGYRSLLPVVTLAMGVAYAARLAIASMLDTTSFPAVSMGYLASAFPPLLMFIGVAVLNLMVAVPEVVRAWRGRKRTVTKTEASPVA